MSVYVEGLNVSARGELLKEMKTETSFAPAQLAIKEMSSLYKKVVNNSQVTEVNKMEKDNEGNIIAHKGDTYHAIKVGDDKDALIKRLQSISKYGLLASEWFGVSYNGYEHNEVPYRLSMHRVYKDGPISDLETLVTMKKSDDGSLQTIPFKNNKTICFFIDYNNEALKPLTQLDLQNSDKGFSTDDNVQRTMRAISGFSEYQPLELALEKAKKRAMDSIDAIKRIYKGKGKSEEEYLENMKTQYGGEEKYINDGIKPIKEKVEIRDKYYTFVPSGIPSKFINGIGLPKEIENDTELISEINKIFPNVPVFNLSGKQLDVSVDPNSVAFGAAGPTLA